MNLQKQLRCVYLHAFTSTLRFTDAVWVALLAARGFSLAQIGLDEGVFNGVNSGLVQTGDATSAYGMAAIIAAAVAAFVSLLAVRRRKE